MLAHYYEFVIAAYEKKTAENEVSQRLVGLSPALIRDTCWEACKLGISKKDERAIADFFGHAASQDAYLNLIKNFDIDKFRPLIKFLKKETSNTNIINIELLAWLIDLPYRPYNDRTDYLKLKAELEIVAAEQPAAKTDEDKSGEKAFMQKPEDDIGRPMGALVQKTTGNTKSKIIILFKQLSDRRKIFMSIILLGIICCIGFVVYKITTGNTGPQSCMVWSEDHFQQVSCNQKIEGAMVIALDSARLHDFKKITQPDTITYNAIGHVWYIKINSKPEFYTADGNHPVHNELRLHPITIYIINKYVKSNE